MRAFKWITVGALLGIINVFAVGILELQARGLRDGAMIDFRNMIVGTVTPQTPFLHMLAMGLCGVVVFYTLFFLLRKRVDQMSISFGFALSSLVLIFGSFTIHSEYEQMTGLPKGSHSGPLGILQAGGSNVAVHLLVLMAIVLIWRLRRETTHRRDTQAQ